MWKFALKRVRSPGLVANPVCVPEGGVWTVDLSEGVNIFATAEFFKHETAFVRVGNEYLGAIFAIAGNTKAYVVVIRRSAFTAGNGKPTNCFPPYESLEKHVRRSRSVFQIWKGGLQVQMPKLEFNRKG